MPSFSFAQAKTYLAPFVSSQGPSDPLVANCINDINERFVTSGQWKGNRFLMAFTPGFDSSNNWYYIDTPVGVESILKVIAVDDGNMNGEIADILSDWYPFSENGLGWIAYNYVGDTELIRMGNVPGTADSQRYRIVGKYPEDRTFYAIVRRGYVPLINDGDLLIPSNRNAYRYGAQAWQYENTYELERAQVYWNLAYQCLNEATQAFEEGEQAEIDIQFKAFSPHAIQNLI
jgi:hypothetical protein